MELKINYQYTYFVYPFIVKEDKYRNYMLRLLRNNKLKIKTFEKEKDLLLYKYFTPKVREFLFSSFSMPHSKVKKLLELPIETRAAAISQFPCTILEYQLEKDIEGNNAGRNGISFKIKKLEVICFNTGICFVVIKTNIEDSNNLSDVINFNYKFREIYQENSLSNNDNINIQLKNVDGTESLIDLIKDIIGSSVETVKLFS